MRKRQGRRLRPIRVTKANELWYRARLSNLVQHTITVCKQELPGMLRGSWPTVMDAEPVDRAINALKAKHLAGLDQLARKWSSLATRKALEGVDTRLANELRRSLGVNVAGVLTHEGRIAGEVKRFLAWNTQLITSVPEELLGAVGAAVNQAFTSGQRVESLASIIDDVGEGEYGEARAALIARDQMNKMNAGFNRVRQDDLGIESYIWWAANDERTRPEHFALHGQTFQWDEPGPLAGTIDGEPCHPGEDIQCFPGSSLLQPSFAIRKAYRRAYTGKLTEVVTASGEVLRATPNHPVLSRRGLVSIQSLNIGDDLFQASLEGFEVPIGDPEHVVTSFDEVFCALQALGVSKRVLSVASWFHGDGADQEVDVVDVDWSLGGEGYPTLSQRFCQDLLTCADKATLPLGLFVQLFGATNATSSSLVRGACKVLSFLWARRAHSNEHAITSVAWLDALSAQVTGDGATADTKAIREIFHACSVSEEPCNFLTRVFFRVVCAPAFAGICGNSDGVKVAGKPTLTDAEVKARIFERAARGEQATRIVEVRHVDFSGHVYNLTTSAGLYATQNLLVSNCRCDAVPVVNIDALEAQAASYEETN